MVAGIPHCYRFRSPKVLAETGPEEERWGWSQHPRPATVRRSRARALMPLIDAANCHRSHSAAQYLSRAKRITNRPQIQCTRTKP